MDGMKKVEQLLSMHVGSAIGEYNSTKRKYGRTHPETTRRLRVVVQTQAIYDAFKMGDPTRLIALFESEMKDLETKYNSFKCGWPDMHQMVKAEEDGLVPNTNVDGLGTARFLAFMYFQYKVGVKTLKELQT